MAIRNEIPFQISFSEGLDDTSIIGSKETQGTLSVALNADLVDESLISKRNGYMPVAAAWGSRKIRKGFEYTDGVGNKKVLVYGEASTITGNSGILGVMSGTSAPSSLLSSLVDNIKPSIVQYRTLAFIFNGANDFLYDGSTIRQIGIDPPNTAPGFITNIPGDLNINGSYLYVYTYYNSVTGAESSPSPPSEIFLSGSDAATSGITISLTSGNSTTADKIKIYRTVSGGSVFFFEDQVPINSTTFDSIVIDSGLSTELETDNSRLPAPATYALVGDNRIHVAGFLNNPNRVQHSKIGINGPMPESFQIDDFTDCNINDGDKIIGLGKASDNITIVKERSVGKLVPIQFGDTGLERSGSPKYVYEEISAQTTGVSHHCITSLDRLTLWLGRDDLYGTDGVNIIRFGKRIRNTIKSLNFAQSHKFSVINKSDTQQIIFSVISGGKTESDLQIVCHYRDFQTTGRLKVTLYSAGPNTTTHPGLVVGDLFSVTVNKNTQYWFGSADSTGLVNRMDYGSNDNTKAIYWDIRSPWISGGRSEARKKFHSFYTFCSGSGIPPNNLLTHTFEKDRKEIIVSSAAKTLSGSGATWGTSTWAGATWASIDFLPSKFFPKKIAYFGRYGVNNIFADQPVVISGMSGVINPFPVH